MFKSQKIFYSDVETFIQLKELGVVMKSEFNCLWIEDNREEILEVYNRLLSRDGWNIEIFNGRAELIPFLLHTQKRWDLVVVDGRMDTEPSISEEYCGQNIILDLRTGRFGEWGKSVPIVLHSVVIDILDRVRTFPWGDPKPLILSKNHEPSLVYEELIKFDVASNENKANLSRDKALIYGTGRIALGVGLPLFQDCFPPVFTTLWGRFSDASSHKLSEEIKRIAKTNGKLTIKIGSRKFRGNVWHDGLPVSDFDKLIESKGSDACEFCLILSNDFNLLSRMINSVSLAAVSIGKNASIVLDQLNAVEIDGGGDLSVLALENDHENIEKVSQNLTKIKVYPCIVDRICSDIEYLGDVIKVNTDSENYSIAFERPIVGNNIFNSHPVAQLVESKAAVEYFHKRKLTLMNTLHWIIALTKAYKAMPAMKSVEDLNVKFMHIVGDTLTEKRMYVMFARLLATRLIRDTDPAVLQEVYEGFNISNNINIAINREFEFGQSTILRSNTTPDSMLRIVKSEASAVIKKYESVFEWFAIDFNENSTEYILLLNGYCAWANTKPYTKKNVEDKIALVNSMTLAVRQGILRLTRR